MDTEDIDDIFNVKDEHRISNIGPMPLSSRKKKKKKKKAAYLAPILIEDVDNEDGDGNNLDCAFEMPFTMSSISLKPPENEISVQKTVATLAS